MTVIKRNGRREKFDIEKLKLSISRAIGKDNDNDTQTIADVVAELALTCPQMITKGIYLWTAAAMLQYGYKDAAYEYITNESNAWANV